MEIIKTNIRPKDVAKVMKEVGYNVPTTNKSSAIAEQLAEANKRPQKSMNDAINAAMTRITPRKEAVAVPITIPRKEVTKPVTTVKEAEKLVEDLKSKTPSVAVTAAKKIMEEVGPKERKTVLIDMSTINTKVTFTGSGWTIKDIRIASACLIRALRIKIREEYRKGIK